MKVVFLENVLNVADAGAVKEVADGYARNYLIPRKLAEPATPQALKRVEAQRQTEARREATMENKAHQLSERLEGLAIYVTAKVGANERLYGSITSAHIADEVSKLAGETIDKRKIVLGDPIRKLGGHEVEVRLAKDVSVTMRVVVEGAEA